MSSKDGHTVSPQGSEPVPPPRFGYEGWLWGLIAAGLIAVWLLRWVFLLVLAHGGWADLAATSLAVVCGGGAVGGLARWRHGRRSTRDTMR